MADKLIHLEIVTPRKIDFSDEVKSFTAPGTEGGFQILPNHAPFISTIGIGKVKFVTKDNVEKEFATSGGVVEVHDNKISMLAETIEPKEDIDVQRAREAKERAAKKLEAAHGHDIDIAKIALLRALNRLKVAGSE
ncbi:MAG: ATP synthase F1 subunit epsilon [Ignavibacteriae bacterium]|nr:MAG: ATP synthase F1 subunit epsilon [Ignavibacteriota bacterium]